jgi:hypothetical protein
MRELGTFAVIYPCWVLVHKDSIVLDDSGKPVRFSFPIAFCVIDNKPSGTTFPVFSDGDLAHRFRQTLADGADYKIIEVDSPERLASALEASQAHADSVSFDQPQLGTGPYAIWPIEYAIEKIRAEEDL